MFGVSMSALETPPGSVIRWQLGTSIAENCNRIVRQMQGDWLWLLGDDHAFEPDVLNRLLGRDVDIVVPACLERWPPFHPVTFSGWSEKGAPYRQHLDFDRYPDGGLVEVHSAGSGGMLIRRHVLEALADPWFEAGVIDGEQLAEDLYFCDKARDAGFRVWCDLAVPFGHITPASVWPQRQPGGWSFGLGFPEGVVISLPPGWFG